MFSVGKGDIFEPLEYIIGKVVSKFGQEIFKTFESTPISELTANEWWHIFYLVAIPVLVIAVVIVIKKSNARKNKVKTSS